MRTAPDRDLTPHQRTYSTHGYIGISATGNVARHASGVFFHQVSPARSGHTSTVAPISPCSCARKPNSTYVSSAASDAHRITPRHDVPCHTCVLPENSFSPVECGSRIAVAKSLRPPRCFTYIVPTGARLRYPRNKGDIRANDREIKRGARLLCNAYCNTPCLNDKDEPDERVPGRCMFPPWKEPIVDYSVDWETLDGNWVEYDVTIECGCECSVI